MAELLSPADEAQALTNKLADGCSKEIDMMAALEALQSDQYDPNNHWKKGAYQLPGIFFEEYVGARLVERYDDFECGPTFDNREAGNKEIDFEANYLWDFKSARDQKYSKKSSSYNMSLNTYTTMDMALEEYDGLGFIVMRYEVLEMEDEDEPEVTERICEAQSGDSSINKLVRAPRRIRPRRIQAWWIDGKMAYERCMNKDLWDTRPIGRKSDRPRLHFSTAEDCGLLVAETEV